MSPEIPAEPPRVVAVVLAAGASRRLGSPKQLLTHRGQTLVRRAVDAARESRCDAIYVVVGAAGEEVANELEDTDVTVVSNPNWEQGLSSSIAAGVEAANDADAWMILLVDQPHLTSAVLNDLLDRYDGTPTGTAACHYAGTTGVPAVFGRDHKQALTTLAGDRGAKDLLANADLLDWEGGGTDIDSPEDMLPQERR